MAQQKLHIFSIFSARSQKEIMLSSRLISEDLGHFRWNRITGSNTWQLRCALDLPYKRCYDIFCYPTLGWLPASRIEYVFKLWCCGKFRLKIQISWKHQQKATRWSLNELCTWLIWLQAYGDRFGNSSHGNPWEKLAWSLLKFVLL